MTPRLAPRLHRLATDRSGAAMVELALSLPLMLLVCFISLDSLRLMWTFQAATAGVHEATRYLARVAPGDICTAGGTLAGHEPTLVTLVGGASGGGSVFNAEVQLLSLATRLDCVTDAGLRQAEVPVATVTVDLRLPLPLHGLLSRIGGDGAGTITARIEEQARIFGL